MFRGQRADGTPDAVAQANVHPTRGVGLVVVPDVSGDDEDVALEKLRLSGLRPGRRRSRSTSGQLAGSVIRTLPCAGARLPRGERVDYVVAMPGRRTEGWSHETPGEAGVSRPGPA